MKTLVHRASFEVLMQGCPVVARHSMRIAYKTEGPTVLKTQVWCGGERTGYWGEGSMLWDLSSYMLDRAIDRHLLDNARDHGERIAQQARSDARVSDQGF